MFISKSSDPIKYKRQMKAYIKISILSILLSLLGCDNDLGKQPSTHLEKDFISLNYSEGSTNVKVKGNKEWYFYSITQNNETLTFTSSTDSIIGDWYQIYKKEKGGTLNIHVNDNPGEMRYFIVSISNGSSMNSLKVEQDGLIN